MPNTIVTLSAPFCINIAIVHYSINDDLTLIQSVVLSLFHLSYNHYFQESTSKCFLLVFFNFFLTFILQFPIIRSGESKSALKDY